MEADLRAVFAAGEDFRVLVRSNFRREIWTQAGFPPERVLTIHKSKGLEFPVVLLDLLGGWSGALETGEEDLIPDEEVRVLYVGLSRAENLLVIARRSAYAERDLEGRLLDRAFGSSLRPVPLTRLPAYLERAADFRASGR